MWTREFESQAYGGLAHRYERLHLIDADEFIFYRFVNFDERMYGKTVSELHAGNLRTPEVDSRYAKLFTNHRLSYWSGSYQTARKETLKHGGTKDRLIFKAYDDASSTFPTGLYKPLKIIDGRDMGVRLNVLLARKCRKTIGRPLNINDALPVIKIVWREWEANN